MSGNRVEIDITGNDADILRAWQRQFQTIDKMDRKLDKLGRSGRKSGMQVKGGFDSALGTFNKFSGVIAGIGGAVGGVALSANTVRMELERIRQLNRQKADTQVPFQDSLVDAYKNSSGIFKPNELEQRIIGIEKETGVTPEKIAQAISSAFSAKGPKNKEEAEAAIKSTIAALKFAPKKSGQELADLTGAGIDLSKRFGFTPEESLGYLQNIGGQARVVDPAMLANNAAPAVANLANYGNSPAESGSLIAALTQGATDKTAAMSGTTAIALAAQLRERGIGKTTAEGIQLLQADPEMRKRFFEGGKFGADKKKYPGASFEKKSEVAIEQLLTPNTVTSTAYNEGINAIGGAAEGQEQYKRTLEAMRLLAINSNTRRESEAASNTARLKDVRGAIETEAMDAYMRAMDDAGVGWMRKQFNWATAETQMRLSDRDPRLIVADLLKADRDEYLQKGEFNKQYDMLDESKFEGTNFTGGGFFNAREIKKPEIPESDQRSAEAIQRQLVIVLDSLQASRDKDSQKREEEAKNMREAADQMKRVADALERQERQPRPPASPVVPPRPAPYKAPAERLNRGDKR